MVWHDLHQNADRDTIKMLTLRLETTPSEAAKLKEQIAAVKDKMSLFSYPSWRDTDTHKSTMVELLKRSAYNAMAFVDENADKLTTEMTTATGAARYFSWVSLTGDTACSTFVRSGNSGGAIIHSLAGDAKPKFYHFSSAHAARTEKMLKVSMKASYSDGIRGKCVIIPGVPIGGMLLDEALLLATLQQVYAEGGSGKKLPVKFESPQLQSDWGDFLQSQVDQFTDVHITASYVKALQNLPASLATITGTATQAALTLATLRVVEVAMSTGARVANVIIKEEDLEMAKVFAAWLFRATSGFALLDSKCAGREKALDSFKSAEKVCEAEQALYDAIVQSEGQKISHKTAIRTPGITAGLLEILVARDHRFVELKGAENIGMGKTKRAYVLKHGLTIDPDEANAELAAAQEEWDAHPESVDEADVRREFRTLQDAATDRSVNDYAAIPIANMTPKQIRLVPAIKALYADQVCLRGTAENPEPDFLLERDEDEPAAFTGETPNLWFRYTSQLKDQHNWTIASRLGFAEAWGKPLGTIQPEN